MPMGLTLSNKAHIEAVARLLGYKVIPPDHHNFAFPPVNDPFGKPIFKRRMGKHYAQEVTDPIVIEHMQAYYGVKFT